MFYGCSSLKVAPELPATTLAARCYAGLFHFCTNLREIRVNLTNWNLNHTANWVADVAPQGRFICPPELPLQYGDSLIPRGWVVDRGDYLCFTATSPAASFSLQQNGYFITPPEVVYRRNYDTAWVDLVFGDTILMVQGDRIYFRAKDETKVQKFSITLEKYFQFKMSGTIEASGNIMSLVDATCRTTQIPCTHCFYALFSGCKSLTRAPELPATTITGYCYYHMFTNTGITRTPVLPAQTLREYCYNSMFSSCGELVYAEDLGATSMGSVSCQSMFNGCKKLTRAPSSLPDNITSESACQSMFQGCTSLEEAPYLPATVLKYGCYGSMFSGCKKLRHIRVGLTHWDIASTRSWVNNVPAGGVFEAPCILPEQYGPANIPVGWTFRCSLPEAPEDTITYLTTPFTPGDTLHYLCFTALDTSAVALNNSTYFQLPNVEYSLNQGDWHTVHFGLPVMLNPGDKVYFRAGGSGHNDWFSRSADEYIYFSITGSVAASGNLMSLLDASCQETVIPCSYCFYELFYGCSALTAAPEMPAMVMKSHCYDWMYTYCTNLLHAPELPATTLASYCYGNMFRYCSGLLTASALPATTLADYCYFRMYECCSHLTEAVPLMARTLKEHCYTEMFMSCTALTYAPDLPMDLVCTGNSACGAMYYNCPKLKQAPRFGATTVKGTSFCRMFVGDTQLSDAPEMPGAPMTNRLYWETFKNCTNLHRIKVSFTSWQNNGTEDWVKGVPHTGRFICPPELPHSAEFHGDSLIPKGWMVDTVDYLTLTATGKSSVGLYQEASFTPPMVLYRLNYDTIWYPLPLDSMIPLNDGEFICFKAGGPGGQNTVFSPTESKYMRFHMTGSIAASGNIMSLVDATCQRTSVPSSYCFNHLFADCKVLTRAPEFPATTLQPYCYEYMFSGCTSLTRAPYLPSTYLPSCAYRFMFYNCTSLISAYDLPTTHALNYSCQSMFQGCNQLKRAPHLPATHLAEGSYKSMFYGCSSLVEAPELPADTLPLLAYECMFYGCRSVTHLKVGWTHWDLVSTHGWVTNVAPKGIFEAPCELPEQYGYEHIPMGWTFLCSGDTPHVAPVTDTLPYPLSDSLPYLCFTAQDTSTISLCRSQFYDLPAVAYKVNNGAWTDLTYGLPIPMNPGDKVYMRAGGDGHNTFFSQSAAKCVYFSMTGKIAASGNLMSLLDATCTSTVIPSNYCFYNLFYLCSSLTSAPEMPATTLTPYCYYNMYARCTGLTQGPDLPADTLQTGSYGYMFYTCTGLTTPGEMHPHYVTANSCIRMYQSCSRLRSIPDLPAKQLGSYCYTEMFSGCTSLTSVPDMVFEVTNSGSCWAMFASCYNLTRAPRLPATQMSPSCYYGMFMGCRNLEEAPELPATQLALHCYQSMFSGCTKLNYIKVGFSEWTTETTNEWVKNVAPSGRFICPDALPHTAAFMGDSLIPRGWVVDTVDYLTFYAVDASTISLNVTGQFALPSLRYRLNTDTLWQPLPFGTSIAIPQGQWMYLSADSTNDYFSYSSNGYLQFHMTGKIKAGGNIMTLLDASGRLKSIPNNFCFYRLFYGCSSLLTAPQLPATTLTQYCYQDMFRACTQLTVAPRLPASFLPVAAYDAMFYGCTSLTYAFDLPIANLQACACIHMFAYCSQLTHAPALPSLQLAEGCYQNMFQGCTSLVEAPALPADTLPIYAYENMFRGCTNLSHIKVGLTHWDISATRNWVMSVPGGGLFEASCELPEQYGYEHIPVGWTFLCSGDRPMEPQILDTLPEALPDTLPYLCFTAQDTATFALNRSQYYSLPAVAYKVNNGAWTDLTYGIPIHLNPGDKAYLRAGGDGHNAHFSQSDRNTVYFTMTGHIAASGNIMSLVDATCASTTIPCPYCFSKLFYICSSLTSAPDMPATHLQNTCYGNMYAFCTGLQSTPDLPADTLKPSCYMYMYNGCTGLLTAGRLPAKVLANSCYFRMYQHCSNLTTAPLLPAEQLAPWCYTEMFYSCTALDSVPDLPITYAASGSCWYMFAACPNLKKAPALPATQLGTYCYHGMFYACSSLTQAPELPATTLADNCYSEMFTYCAHIDYLKVGFTQWHPTATDNWVKGVAPSGRFICPGELPHTAAFMGDSLIPRGWVVDTVDYLIFTASGPSSFSLHYHLEDSTLAFLPPAVQYRVNDGPWSDIVYAAPVQLEDSDRVYLRAKDRNISFSLSDSAYVYFTMTGSIAASGNIMALLDKDCQTTTLPGPACYSHLFKGCSSLTSAPRLPATVLTEKCYERMFEDCYTLTSIPDTLPAMVLTPYCYRDMFSGCHQLTHTPVLPATHLAQSCYSYMFYRSGIEHAPDLMADTLATDCYMGMFRGCTHLNYIKVGFYDWHATATQGWVTGVNPGGTFEASCDLPEIYDAEHIPAGWDFLCDRCTIQVQVEVEDPNMGNVKIDYQRR